MMLSLLSYYTYIYSKKELEDQTFSQQPVLISKYSCKATIFTVLPVVKRFCLFFFPQPHKVTRLNRLTLFWALNPLCFSQWKALIWLTSPVCTRLYDKLLPICVVIVPRRQAWRAAAVFQVQSVILHQRSDQRYLVCEILSTLIF